MVGGSDGSLFLGTGNEGKVFRIDAQGKGSMFFDAAELEAPPRSRRTPNGGLYVADLADARSTRSIATATQSNSSIRGQIHLGLAVDGKATVRRNGR